MERLRFPVVWLASISAVGLLYTIVFLQSVIADPKLQPVLEDLTEHPFVAYFLAVSLLTPLMAAGWSFWYHYRPPSLEKMWLFTFGRTSLLIAGMLLANVVVILTVPSHSTSGHPGWNRIMRHHSTALDSPLVSLLLVALCAWGIAWVFKEHTNQPPEVDRRFVYALSLGQLVALAILSINKAVEGPFPLPF